MAYIRKLRPLPLFFLTWGAYVPLLLAILLGDWLYSYRLDYPWVRDVHEFLGTAVGILTITGIPLYFIWRFALPFELRNTLPPNLRPDLKNFYLIYWSPAISALLSFGFLTVLNFSQSQRPDGVDEAIFLTTCFAFFGFWAISYVQTSHLTARLLLTAELGRVPTAGELTGTFMLVMMGVFGGPFLANRYRVLEDYAGEYV